jgi:glycosyltransferase involved in cell wall biosynthesis
MRVLHIHSGNLYGGVETFLLTLARSRHFAPGMEMSVALCFEGPIAERLRAAGVAPVMLGEVRLRRPDKVRRARQALRSLLAAHSFDVVVCHQAWPYAIFGSVVKSAGIPLVSWVHMPQTGGHWLDRLAARIEPDCYICNSRFTAAQLPPTNARVEVVYAPVESTFAPSSPNTTAHTPLVIIQVSRMEAWKGQRVLLEALAELRDVPSWECWQVGGAQRPAEMRYLETLKADAERSGISERVRFLGQRSNVGELLASSHIFCQPNVEPEAFGISFVEALYARLPVVTSSLGGAVEVVDDTCGVLVPPNDSAALAAALANLLRNRDERQSLGRGGPPRAKALCDPETQIIAIAAVLDSIACHRAVAQLQP